MTTRALFAALAIASLAAPLAAYADAPSGEINTIFAVDESVKVDPPKFDRREHRTYVEDILAAPTSTPKTTVTREQVREELAKTPPERVGA
jgi:hypothetical protein